MPTHKRTRAHARKCTPTQVPLKAELYAGFSEIMLDAITFAALSTHSLPPFLTGGVALEREFLVSSAPSPFLPA